MSGAGQARPSKLGRPFGKQFGRQFGWRFAALIAAAALITGCGGPAPSQAPATSTPSSGASPAATPAPTPTATPIAWTSVQVTGLPKVATLEPTKSGIAGVAVDTTFKLTSLDGRAPADLAQHLVADPAISFTVASTSGASAILKPAVALAAGVAYKIALRRSDGSTEATWAATAVGPLAVTASIPGSSSTGVPLDAGIEITFNQAGVAIADLAKHFSISPVAAGKFIANGRTIAFAPDKPLAAKTLYTVAVSRGLAADAGDPMADDFRLQFETAGGADPIAWIRFAHPLNDATPRERASFTVWFEMRRETTQDPSRSLPITVHRLATLGDAQRAYRAIAAFPDWTLASGAKPVALGGLTRVLSATLKITQTQYGGDFIQLPQALSVGWYVVTATYEGVPRQTFLQVTDTAAFVLVSDNKTLVWVNSLATRLPAVGATATIAGTTLGAADADGMITAPTPVGLAAATGPDPLITVRYGGQTTFRPVNLQTFCGNLCSAAGAGAGAALTADDYWSMLQLDRNQFRPTDTVAAYGVARLRATGAVPAKVSLSIWADGEGTNPALAIATATAAPDARGMFAAKLPITNLPNGQYRVRLTIGAVQLGDAWMVVAPYIKPAWRMAISLSRHALIEGQSVTATAAATFFEGTPVAGASLVFGTDSADNAPTVTASTGSDGLATADVPVPLNPDVDQFGSVQVQANPQLPEEADLGQSAAIYVFRASALVSVNASVIAKRLSLTGAVNTVALDRYETTAGIADPSSVDPKGAGRPGATVTVHVTEVTSYAVQTGTAYNFITKRVEPVYDYRTRSTTVATRTLKTDSNGAFTLGLDVTGGGQTYNVSASYTDEAGRTVSESASAAGADSPYDSPWAYLSTTVPDTHVDGYSVGDSVSLTFGGGLAKPPMARYMYLVSQRGLLTATLSNSPTFSTVFTAEAVPAIQFSTVRFNGVGYEVGINAYTAALRAADRKLDISLTADKAHYQPGDTATVSVVTRDPSGAPVAASLFLRAIDEKLYAIGAASDPEPFGDLYRSLDSGVLGWAWSHHTPAEDMGGSGDATGGGDSGVRSDFRDFLYQGAITTGADGRATVQIPLSDDLTSWHVSGVGVDAALDTGAGSVLLGVGLPFFVDVILPAELLTADKPVLRVRAFGTGLTAGDAVTFTVASDTLGMSPVTVTGTAFTAVEVPLPTLAAGTQRLQISASHGTGAAALTDAMIRTFAVVDHRSTQLRTSWVRLDAPLTLQSGAGVMQLVLADAGRGRVIPLLQELAGEGNTRSDTAVAAALAKGVLTDQFGLDLGAPADDGALAAFTREDGISIVPWGGADIDATVLAALAADPTLAPAKLVYALRIRLTDMTTTRSDRLEVLAGLAALGEPVLDEIHAASLQTDLTPTEQVFLAVGALFAGDETLAGGLEQQLLTAYGQRGGAQVRLNFSDTAGEANTVATAWLAIVAASLGDPIAADMDAWLTLNPPKTTSVAAQRALAARGWAMRVAGAPAVATLTIGGSAQSVAIEAGQPRSFTLTPAQAAGAVVTPVAGSVLVVQTWDSALDPATLTAAPGVTITRSVSPSGAIGLTNTVAVTYEVDLGKRTRGTCWRLVDMVPSGLAPLAGTTWDTGSGNVWPGETPDNVTGQRVEFCVGVDAQRSLYSLRYTARVVAPGTYVWEPAVLQMISDPAAGVVMPATTITIAGATP